MMSLKFPKIVDAFIPQSYKCLAYQRKDTKLEDESVWKQIPAQHDLDKFFIKYLYSQTVSIIRWSFWGSPEAENLC